MRERSVHNIDDREEKVVRGLVQIGAKPNVARVLFCLARTPATTSAAIERETGIRQTNVTVAMKELLQCGWIRLGTIPPLHKGRPRKKYELAKPLPEIARDLQQMVESRLNRQLSRLKKLSRLKEMHYYRS
jgi:predicted transcriptional regulator